MTGADLSAQNGTMTTVAPSILVNEGAGVVEAVEPDASGPAAGDHVVVSWVPQCGSCFYCERNQPHLCEVGGQVMSAGSMRDGGSRTSREGHGLPPYCAVGVFAETAVMRESSLVKVDRAMHPRVGALLGCGVPTGVGAAVNTANIAPGDTVAVIGCGGVGPNVIQGAKMQRAERIVATDLSLTKRELARRCGATDTLQADAGDVVEAVKELTAGRGAGVAFEVIGLRATAEQALAMTRNGGETVLVGVAAADVTLETAMFRGLVRYGKTLKGWFYGSADVRRDVPALVTAYLQGRPSSTRSSHSTPTCINQRCLQGAPHRRGCPVGSRLQRQSRRTGR
jgi:Zn-dependent alcohol dehydrogenase